jgi:hypothetical protein
VPALPTRAAEVTDLDVQITPDANGWRCLVTVRAATTTEHRVRVDRADLERLAPGDADPAELVRRSFAFLLEREPNTSILREFDLPAIGGYFPEFEASITSDRQGRARRGSSSRPR